MNACNHRRKKILESNISPFQDFYSQLLAYAVAGLTVVGSVFVCCCWLVVGMTRLLPFHPDVAWLFCFSY